MPELTNKEKEFIRDAAIGKAIREILERDNRRVPNFAVNFIAAAQHAVHLAKNGNPEEFNV